MDTLPRALTAPLRTAASAMPVVLVTGARQTGKSTLVRDLVDPDRLYLTLDDLDLLEQAEREPDALLGRAARMTLDEVQRAPELLLAVKRAVDRKRVKGRFFLTGSANLLSMRKVADTLAGRAAYLTLWPMTRRERLGLGTSGLWGDLLASPDEQWPEVLDAQTAARESWTDAVRRGGYPTPALDLDDSQRATWFTGYVKTYLERDIQDISAISALPDLRRLMRAATLRLGQLANQTELGRDVALPQPTVHRYLNLLETSYQLIRIPAYAVNRTRRLIKTPKIYWCDAGLAFHLSGLDEPAGSLLENLVLLDLLVWREENGGAADVLYWRTASGEEVDFVVETGRTLLPVEVKATQRPSTRDARGLRTFHDEYGRRARAGLLLHDGDRIEWIAPRVLAVPWWKVV